MREPHAAYADMRRHFLTSGPAILAALQIQNAFDMNAAHKRDAGIKVQVAGCGAEPSGTSGSGAADRW